MAIFKGGKNKPAEEDAKPEPRVALAKDVYMVRTKLTKE